MTDDELEAQIRAQVALLGWQVSTNDSWPDASSRGFFWFDIIDSTCSGYILEMFGQPTRRRALDEVATFLKGLS